VFAAASLKFSRLSARQIANRLLESMKTLLGSSLYLPLVGWLALVVLTGCSASRSANSSSGRPAGPTLELVSVRPGINADYLKPDLNASNWVERFEREGREIYDQRREILAAAKLQPSWVVADVGAGTGLFTPMIAAQVGLKGSVFAVDIVPNFLRLIEQRCAEQGIRNVRTVLGTERSVELPPNSINAVFICDVYHHFEYPQSSLASIHRALRRNGEIFLIDFKREPGVSSEWILNHVRAGQALVTQEIEAAGFRKLEQVELLKDNYVLRFQKVGH